MENELLGDELRQLAKERREAVEKFELLKGATPEFLKNIARESDDFKAIVIKNLDIIPKLTIHLFTNWLSEQKIESEIIRKVVSNVTHNDLQVSWKP